MRPDASLEQVVDHSPSIIFTKDLAGRYLFVNRQFARAARRSREDILGRTSAEIFPPAIAQRFCENDRRVLEERRAIEFEDEVEIDGDKRIFLASVFPLLRADGTPYAVSGILRDITWRKRNEEALRRAALAVSAGEGQAVFERLACELAAILGVDVAFIAGFAEDGAAPGREHMRTLGYCLDGRVRRNFSYALAGTPCATVVGRQFKFLAEGARTEFPNGDMFAKLELESYAAYPLHGADGEALGLIAVMDRGRLRNPSHIESVLKIFAVRAAGEIERARGADALRVSEASYRAIFEASEDPIFIHDWESGAIVEVSPTASDLYGYSREELRRMTVGELSADESPYRQAEALRRIEQAKASEGPVRFEWRGRHKDGHLMWHEVTLKAATIAGRRRILAFVRDVTARKDADEALRASEEQYRAIFRSAADSMVLRDAEFRVVDVNPAYEAMSGRRREEVLGRSDLTMSDPALNDHVRRLHRRALAGETVQWEARARRKDGEGFDIESRGVPITHRGRPHVLYVGRDITARKRAEEALRASEEQYRSIFNAAADALVLRDAQFRIVDVNPAYEMMSGYRREEVIGLARVVANPPEAEQEIRSLHARALAGEQVMLETKRVRRDGRRVDVELRGVPIRHRGQPHVLYIGRDISERKRAEAERASLEAQLRQAHKMEAIGHLAGGIAHDFNNILTGVMGYATLAAERPAAQSDPKLAAHLEQVLAACGRARDLIKQMLTFSRGGRGAARAVALEPLVRQAIGMLRPTLPSTLEISADLDPAVPAARLDPVHAEQVLMNLCINARDAMQGKGAVRVWLRRSSLHQAVCSSCRTRFDGTFVEMAVADAGSGIAPEVMERMFEPFFSTKEAGRGSGMGLSIVHGIVHEHGGHIVVESSRSGSVFRVLFPPLAGAAPGERTEGRPARARPRVAGRVLVVDDEDLVAGFMQELLESWGLEVTALTSAEHARQAFYAAPARFDLVLTDQTMPGMTGLELARSLRALRKDLPVILYSGYADAVPEAQLRQAAIDLVHKPIDQAELLGALSKHLKAQPHTPT